jgi:hypothetical protein
LLNNPNAENDTLDLTFELSAKNEEKKVLNTFFLTFFSLYNVCFNQLEELE